MKKYELYAIVNGYDYCSKLFKSREQAEKKMASILLKENLQVNYKLSRERGHAQEFVCEGYKNMFFITKVTA